MLHRSDLACTGIMLSQSERANLPLHLFSALQYHFAVSWVCLPLISLVVGWFDGVARINPGPSTFMNLIFRPRAN